MRLAKVSTGHRFKHRLILKMIKLLSGRTPPDVVKTLFYRPEFFGAPFSALVQRALRGPSGFSVGERELFAAATSRWNECEF